jgi:nucleotide-binding universal stress UspA family protein
MYEHILVAVDGSTLAEEILAYALPLAEGFNAKVTLLRATTPNEIAIPTATPFRVPIGAMPYEWDMFGVEQYELLRKAEQVYLNDLAQRLRELHPGLLVTWICPEAPAGQAILDQARELNVDLIALTTHGRSGLARMIMGSTADEVLRKATCPVLLLRVLEHLPVTDHPGAVDHMRASTG